MPNWCNYQAHIKGKKEAVLKLAEWLQANYKYSRDDGLPPVYVERDGKEIPTEHHIGYRVFDFYIENYGDEEDGFALWGCGDCAWSVMSCMFNLGIGCYMSDKGLPQESKSISINDACKELGVSIEIYSTEPGCAFAEHYLINSEGETVINEETEYYELWFGNVEGDDYADYLKYCESEDFEPDITKEEWDEMIANGEESIVKGGFADKDGDLDWSI